MQLSKRLGKIGVLVGNCMGFVGNRMFGPYRREAQFLVEEGAGIEAVDKALYDYVWPWGRWRQATSRVSMLDGASARNTVTYRSQAFASRSLKIIFASLGAMDKRLGRLVQV